MLLYHLWPGAFTLDQKLCLLSFVPLLQSSFLGMFFFFFFLCTPSLHLLCSQTACLADVLCSKLAPTLYPVIIIVPLAEDVKINRSGESGGDWGRRRRRAWWLTMDLLSAATSLQRKRKLEIYTRKRWRTVTIRKDVEFVEAVLYYWHKFRVEAEGEENRRVLEKDKGKAELRER